MEARRRIPNGRLAGTGRSREVFIGTVPIGSISVEAHTHFAVGFGLAFKRFQIDVGGDFSDQTAIGSISVVYSF